jgi:hypothetical protein
VGKTRTRLALHNGPTAVDGEQTGVSIQLPILFDSKKTQALRPGAMVGNTPVLPERFQPPGITLPGLRFTCETVYADTQNPWWPASMPMCSSAFALRLTSQSG